MPRPTLAVINSFFPVKEFVREPVEAEKLIVPETGGHSFVTPEVE